VSSVIHEAIDKGVNYIDLFSGNTDIRDKIGVALAGRRDKAVIAGHLGAAEKYGQYCKIRDQKQCERLFYDLLSRLRTDYIDILMLHFVDLEEEYEKVFNGGILELAQRLQQEGKARFIGMSGHNLPVALKAVRSGRIDVLMYPVNMAGNAMPGREELLNTCFSEGVGLVAMKTFAGGTLLQKEGTVSIDTLSSGWRSFQRKISASITAIQCISYTLSQTGVSTVVPGVRNVDELQEALYFLEATDQEKDFAYAVNHFHQYLEGGCVYCNHCLPCPSGIDVGGTIRLVETAKHAFTYDLQDGYNALPTKASDCVECGSCMQRCPFGVDVISKMKEAKQMFEGTKNKKWIRFLYWRLRMVRSFQLMYQHFRKVS
jgi:hypothetical protein